TRLIFQPNYAVHQEIKDPLLLPYFASKIYYSVKLKSLLWH
ncbi:15494_t:CDS:1, partial [Dentiscutata erythropus]